MSLFFHTHYWYAVQYSTVDICDTESTRGGWFAVEQDIRQGWVLAPLLFNTFFAAFINNVAYTRFKPDKYFMDALVHLRKRTGAGGGEGEQSTESQPF